jgi:hypothetical protein
MSEDRTSECIEAVKEFLRAETAAEVGYEREGGPWGEFVFRVRLRDSGALRINATTLADSSPEDLVARLRDDEVVAALRNGQTIYVSDT